MTNPTVFQTSLTSEVISSVDDIKSYIDELPDDILVKTNKKISYFNIPVAFDIETSSFYEDGKKSACIYIWQFGFNGHVIVGREWSSLLRLFERLVVWLELNNDVRLIVYVHNLSYEFQWIRKYFNWKKVFSADTRKPIYALTDSGIEFRCSYLQSGYSLANLSKQLLTYKVNKMVGYLDYKKIRHSQTPLTDKELLYCVNDVKVVMAYIQEQIEIEKGIHNIPLTKTGYVRRYCRKACYYDKEKGRKSDKYENYTRLMRSLTLEVDEFKQWHRCFQGGFTHANPSHVREVMQDVASADINSSYPTVCVCERFPMSKGEKVHPKNKAEFEKNIKLYCCIFDIELTNVRPAVLYDNYISYSKTWDCINPILNNGRVVSADSLKMTVTEVDWRLIKRFYHWDDCRISNMRRYMRGYLPTDFVKAILKLYQDKTTLKGLHGTLPDGRNADIEYMLSKSMLNSCYGMMVQNPCKGLVEYDEDWTGTSEVDYDTAISKYNKSRNRFTFYPWGVYVCAYARQNLLDTLHPIGMDGDNLYCDTDSIKFINGDRYMDVFKEYDKYIRRKLQKAMDFHGLSYDEFEPVDIKGVKHCLGVWDIEAHYDKFKTLGAKRYLVQEDDSIELTVSGLNKKTVVPYMLEHFKDPFEAFDDNLYIPKGFSGKNTHAYIDDEISGLVTDYQGNTAQYHELSCVHIEESDYDLSLSRQFIDYLMGVRYSQEV